MTTPKRKIKAKPFITDLRNGMRDERLMEKYGLSHNQLQRVLQKLVDAGAIDEMELFMRTSLSESAITNALVEIKRSVQELGGLHGVTFSHDLKAPSEVTITEKVKTIGKVVGAAVSRLARTG